MKYHIITYGCQHNKSDTERIIAVFKKMGGIMVSKINEADLVIINTCSVRQSVVDRVYEKIKTFQQQKIRHNFQKSYVILTGCILKKDKEKLKNKVDFILDIKNLSKWPEELRKTSIFFKNICLKVCLKERDYFKISPYYQSSFSACVPIIRGCNNFCSYCVVPYTRGREVTRPIEDIFNEVKNLIDKEYKEIWLLGQNVNSYLSQNSSLSILKKGELINFAKLLKIINEIPGNFWIRFITSHPKDFSDELIETIAKCQKITPYIHLPVQSGDNEILKKMNRNYKIEKYKKLIKKIRIAFKQNRKGLDKEINLSTDIIVGFPTESQEQFEKTVKLFNEIKFDMVYIAQYSIRSNTSAAKLKDDVSQKEKKRRWKILNEILEKTALEQNKKYLNKRVEVLVEREKNGYLIGKTRNYKTVKFEILKKKTNLKTSELIGQFIKVKIIYTLPWGLYGYTKK